jgi:hypothetical protein
MIHLADILSESITHGAVAAAAAARAMCRFAMLDATGVQ